MMAPAATSAAVRTAAPVTGSRTAGFAFGMPEVEQWAQFSSDRNPIHFDLARARVAGLDALIVHGMLALMPVKQSVARMAPATGWTKFRALFRHPIPHGRAIALDAAPGGAGLRFRVCAAVDQFEHFRGTYGPADDPTPALDGEQVSFETPLDYTMAERFAACYPAVREAWIALDAVVFSEFMRTRLHIVEDLAQAALLRRHGAAPASKVVVQLSHTVTFDAAFFGALAGPAAWDALRYAMCMPELVASEQQLSGTVLLPVMSEGRLVMLMEVGLVSKFDVPHLHSRESTP